MQLRVKCILGLALATSALAADKVTVRTSGYRVLFDPQPQGFRANTATGVLDGQRLQLSFAGPMEDDEAGTVPYLVNSTDLGRHWSKPEPFATGIREKIGVSAANEASYIFLFGPTQKGTAIAIGYHVARGTRKEKLEEDMRFRGSSLLTGRREKGGTQFEFRADPPGKFLAEQFGAGGVQHSSGRIVLTVWGAARDGENWQCGVLLSDDDGRSWRYRSVGYEPALGIRDKPETPAGYNEQTLFETKQGAIVSIIRGREKLGRIPESPKDTWYFRSVSTDRGESWSRPEPTNLAGTGAPAAGITLSDGSLLVVSRLPYSRKLYSLSDPKSYGLHLARSFDDGKTWSTEWIRQSDPEGHPFDNYYNVMNGQFLRKSRNRWIYLFGQFSVKSNVHRVLAFDVETK